MAQDTFSEESIQQRTGLLKDQVRLVKRKDSDRYEIVSIRDKLSYEKGFFVAIRACQLLAQKNDGLILVGIAGPSGAGKTIFTEKILNFMPSIAVISMDNYNDATRVIDGNFDDPRLTDYDTLLKNIHDLKAGKHVEVPIYDFKASMRTGYRTIEVPSSRIVIIEGIYALSEKLRPFLDLRVSVTGGVHFDLVKRVFRDIQRAGQAPQEIIHQISETVYPMYKAFIEPDLQTAHIRIINKFNPFTGFHCPTYILKSRKDVTVDQIKSVMPEEHTETMEQTYDIYLLPPGEDPESCQSYLRMRNRDGKYNLMFEEWVTDSPFVISPRITFEVSVRLLGGLMALGYTIAAILKRSSHVFSDERVSVKIDWLEQLNRHYVQGCDGSVLLDDTYTLKGEKKASINKHALKGFGIIDRIKNKLESECPGIVSCADILTVAARDATILVGGPYWHVPLGRKDSKTAGYDLATSNLPGANGGLLSLISMFLYQGLSVTDLVALSGAHTIGMARCVNFRDRIYGDYKETSRMNPVSESNLKYLKTRCPATGGEDNKESAMDNVTPNLFDNSFYHLLLRGEGLLNSDQELYSSIWGIETKKLVEKYAENPVAFFEQFSESMVKMGNITNAQSFVDGEVRKNCRFVNT